QQLVSRNGKCASNGNGATCLKSGFGNCCSQYGCSTPTLSSSTKSSTIVAVTSTSVSS
ncbi:hypothetical protein GQ44DRAFT_577940, partial [Phaeosphaeriaceae sp. PMI808]